MATKAAKRTRKNPTVRYIVDARGRKTEAVLPISLYQRLMEQAEGLEDIRQFDKAMKQPGSVTWKVAKRQLDL